MFWNPSLTGFRMAANNRTVPARKPQATGLKSRSAYLRMDFLVVNVRNSQGVPSKRSFLETDTNCFQNYKFKLSYIYSITLAKMIWSSIQVMELK